MPRIDVDEDLCQGHAMCELEAPNVFAVPGNGTVSIIAPVTPDTIEAVRLAVRHCPTHALRLEED